MLRIVIQNLHKKEIFTNDEDKNLLELIHQNHVDWMFACGGKGRCTTCRAIVLQGSDQLSELSPVEEKFRANSRLQPNERLACQCSVLGDVVIKVAEENKFMHLEYSED
ncbi:MULTISPECIES: 2Fe-2S iron-sulfur cluster-binding protein [Reichenbachiella]|uniref:Ferredoxin, 2Fe-2S n=1 Tax=Reichenbachiella agariperforans TaxID=156994 RepID=A0A1M6TV98_REIAG|nr:MULTISPECIES: 2Fe-2S iron-sulfur cluster-binding protein [Reichenbachiella]MBU2915588.1 (2Fe-2S)-binding protein [Reichenbachiella agariperforans]RJE71350.1 ferredoxin [Reichenbachiella sp. MSK19-1]SHK60824.1 ferredoxin, 2Fe-2S [Reichenbachiella agariperforans]